MEAVEYINENYIGLTSWLIENWGKKAVFTNGCIIWLEDDDGLIYGTDPYGKDWFATYNENIKDNIKNWLEYWDEDRTETGELIVKQQHA